MSVFDRLIASSLPFVPKPLVGYFARPYIAGETLEDQARVVRALNDEGFLAATGILGELVERREEAEGAVADYQNALLRIEQDKLDSNVHVKPTLFGLKIDKEFCYQSTRKLVAFAREHSNFVRIDMEDSSCTDDTLELFFRLHEEFENVGAVIQAYLKRSLEDVRRLAEVEANVRLCKGIYIEPPDVAYRDKEQVRSNYTSLLEKLLGAGCYVGIATHDEKLVSGSYGIVDRLGLDASQYEFQMLLGVTPGLRGRIRDAGHRLRVAVPFGPAWYPYSLRRFRENPTIAGYVFKALFQRDS
jgi:proline dehydrogenase